MSVALLLALFAADYVPAPEPCPSDLNVGCFYFPGHFSPMRWMPFKAAGFPMPLLGYYRDGEPEVSDWHIKWAVEHGISFFAFDWYYHYEQGASAVHNRALDLGFLRARYRDHMKFCLMWCNEGKDERYTEEHLLRLAQVLTEHYFSQPNYLRVEDDNALIVSVPAHLLASFGPEGTAAVFERMAEVSRKAGYGGLFPIAKQDGDRATVRQAGFRATTAYNYPTAGMTDEQRSARSAPYADMVRGYEEQWKQVTDEGVLPYIVPVTPGWDSRPWYQDRALVRTNPRPRLFYEMCLAARRYVDPDLRMVLAECWNEFGEGSYVEPTAQYGFGFLDAMRDAFCPDNPHHVDLVPLSVGLTAPVFGVIPETAETLMARGVNMLYNGDMEEAWGWVTFGHEDARLEGGAHWGQQCLIVPAGQGVKTQWLVPIPPSKQVRVQLWARVPDGATLRVTAALFRGTAWLGRYAEVATIGSTAGHWQAFDFTAGIADAEADRIDIEFVALGAHCAVDDVAVHAVTP